jgi:ABC-type Zn uptake system ZnuABC Zn-binding protein ZnuA
MKRILISLLLILICLSACQAATQQAAGGIHVLAVESFLADIAQNIAGDRLVVESLVPLAADPHAYQPSPQDVVKISNADVLIINGANLETFIFPILQNAGERRLEITASAGLTPLPDPSGQNPEGDPHFWLDPTNVIKYSENIRDGLSQVDPADASYFDLHSKKYIASLQSLDTWIESQVGSVLPSRRMLVTNHETLGYFAKRYGFRIVGAILPSVTSGAAPSAQELAALITQIRSSGVPAIFLETGTNPQLADQIASETGVKVVSELYTHNLSVTGGPASTYIEMMRHDVITIVEALK